MKKLSILLATGLSLAASCPSWGEDIYVYQNQEQVTTMKGVHKIVFTDEGMTLLSNTGKSAFVSKNDWQCFTTYERMLTSVDQPSSLPVNIFCDGKRLQIRASKDIHEILLYALNGTILKRLTPKGRQIAYNLKGWSAGVYIVKVFTEEQEISQKFVIK